METEEFVNNACDVPNEIFRALEPYKIIDYLSIDEECTVCLCRNPHTNEYAIAKIKMHSEAIRQLRNEYDLLKIIADAHNPQSEFFPRPIKYETLGDEEAPALLIRSYFPGKTLEDIVEQQPDQPGIPASEAMAYIVSVLERLSFLHSLTPPIIHRDIKPQNVIVNDRKECFLIDLGISRIFQKGKNGDTNIAGTRVIAPPEQFGYRQTDVRSDIYSVGVLLRYCLTGDYSDQEDKRIGKTLRIVIKKATRFDPDQRYQTAEQMLCALQQQNPVTMLHHLFSSIVTRKFKTY